MDKGRNTSQMNSALERLRAERIRHQQTSEYQIKVGPYNFYPGKGTIFMDGDREAHPERGLDEFVALLRKLKARNPNVTEQKVSREPIFQKGTNGFDLRQAISDPEEAERFFRCVPKTGR
ncbi:hypothetical protein JJB99_00905 [Bradyrhizobium diazoefficiens]|uniref:hypothetical protein n=1 Tax=Bradyrhizobium diazoefficiens TaxID=1355477 RepID=UPI00190BCD07|nr:hypothetical protein [Bradyrhizobium diazoefficiens]QQO14788.1 hypothetical protein JJB99_00905 [Bradyrhizobium diazoefficiens]